MRHSILAFLFLALAMTVMSAPTKGKAGKKAPTCTNRAAFLAQAKSKKGGAPAKKAAVGVTPAKAIVPAKAAPAAAKRVTSAKGVAKKGPKKRDLDSDSELELFERASDTKLCGMKLRGKSASMCQGNPGYFKEGSTYRWSQWEAFKSKIKSSTVPSRYQCDHAFELQATVVALEGAHFCQAWAALEKNWKILAPDMDVKKTMKEAFESAGSLKPNANYPAMLFYVDTQFNEDKRAWVSSFLRGSPAASSTKLKGYFNPATVTAVNQATAAIDTSAYDLLETIHGWAQQYYNWDNPTEEESTAYCDLDTALFTTYKGGKPTQTWWTSMLAHIQA